VIGGCGLGLYYLAFKAGISLHIVAAGLPDVWWRIPVLLLSALQDGLLEEVLVVGYLLSRLRLIGMGPERAVVIAGVFRGTYHLTQGVGRLHRQRDHGRHFQRAVLPLAADQPDDHRAHADQFGGVYRVRAAGAARLMAALSPPSALRRPV
jgi:hypothetical protein